jgi:hypothetical protein
VVKRLLFAVALICAHTLTAPISNAFETRCSVQPDYLLESPDIWESKNSQDLSYKVYWKLRDPESCITGIGKSKATLERYPLSELILSNFTFERSKDSVIVSSQIQVSQKSLESLANKDIDRKGGDLNGRLDVEVELIRDEPKGKNIYLLKGDYSLKNLWSDWFAKLKGTYSDACSNLLANGQNKGSFSIYTGGNFIRSGEYSLKSVTDARYLYQLVIPNATCIDLVYAGPVSKPSYGSFLDNEKIWPPNSYYDDFALDNYAYDPFLHANYPFWAGTSSEYFQEIKSDNSFVRVFASKCSLEELHLCKFDKWTNLQTEQKFSRVGSDIVIDISISRSILDKIYLDEGYLSFFHGSYSRYFTEGAVLSGRGWSTSCTTLGNTTTCRSYSPSTGGTIAANTDVAFQSTLSVLLNPVLDAENKAKAAAELKVKQEALAKASALEANRLSLEADRLAQQKQSCLQHNIEVEKLYESLNQLKNLYPTKFKSYFEARRPGYDIDRAQYSLFNSKIESDCDRYGTQTFASVESTFSRTKELWSSVLEWDLKNLASIELSVKPTKKSTITCVKGKLTKKVTAVKPTCPKGYQKK